VLGERTLPRWAVCLITSAVPATLLVDVNRPGSQEDLVSNWEPARSLVEDAIYGAEFAPCLPALAVARLPVSGRGWAGPQRLALL